MNDRLSIGNGESVKSENMLLREVFTLRSQHSLGLRRRSIAAVSSDLSVNTSLSSASAFGEAALPGLKHLRDHRKNLPVITVAARGLTSECSGRDHCRAQFPLSGAPLILPS